MLNFIVYEDEESMEKKITEIIIKFIGNKKENYKIVTLNKYDRTSIETLDRLTGKKIYLLDIEVPGKTGLDLARYIRNHGDWLSPIIMVTSHKELKDSGFTSRVLMLDFIIKDDNMLEKLKESLYISYKIIKTHKAFTFQYNGEIYNIPYHDILFFEKDLNDNYTSIVTKQESYKIKESISKIEESLENDLRFFKCHRSFIINLHNVIRINLNDNVVKFSNEKEAPVSRNRKKILKETLENSRW